MRKDKERDLCWMWPGYSARLRAPNTPHHVGDWRGTDLFDCQGTGEALAPIIFPALVQEAGKKVASPNELMQLTHSSLSAVRAG